MKKMKKKSYKSTLLILLMTAILLIVSTYAWFTSNRTVTVETIEVEVGAVNGLQISTNATTWKTRISNTDITSGAYSGANNKLPTNTIKPVSSALGTDSSNGYMNMYYGNVEANNSGIYQITTTKEVDSTQDHYIVFDMFLKVDVASAVYLTNSSSVVGKTQDDIDRGLQNAARIAFVKEGNVPATGDATGLKGAQKVILWEPNNNVHTDASIRHASDTYGQTITASQVFASYPGIGAAFTSTLVAAMTADETNIVTVEPTIATGSGYVSQTTNFQKFDDLSAGITKYRVYMWVEGQDYDCQNSASGSTMQFNLQFSLDNSVSGS